MVHMILQHLHSRGGIEMRFGNIEISSSNSFLSRCSGFRKNGRKIKVKAIDAYIYHYGWVQTAHRTWK
jgi:hypothetical protein